MTNPDACDCSPLAGLHASWCAVYHTPPAKALQVQTDACTHCARLIVWAAAPKGGVLTQTGYTGYWYHDHNNHVLCDGPDAMEHASNRAVPVGV